MGEVTTVSQVQAHNRVTRTNERVHDRCIGLCSGVGLDVRVLGAEEVFDAFNCQAFHRIGVLAPP